MQYITVEVLAVAILLGLGYVTGSIATEKRHSFWAWALFGALFPMFGMLCACAMAPKERVEE